MLNVQISVNVRRLVSLLSLFSLIERHIVRLLLFESLQFSVSDRLELAQLLKEVVVINVLGDQVQGGEAGRVVPSHDEEALEGLPHEHVLGVAGKQVELQAAGKAGAELVEDYSDDGNEQVPLD